MTKQANKLTLVKTVRCRREAFAPLPEERITKRLALMIIAGMSILSWAVFALIMDLMVWASR